MPDYFACKPRAAIEEPFKSLVDIVHGEHDALVAEGVHWGVTVIGNRFGGRDEMRGQDCTDSCDRRTPDRH